MLSQIQKNVVLAPFTTFKIGGPAKFFATSSTKEELIELVKWAKANPPTGEMPVFVLGGGSNILVSDKGFNGLVIKVQNSGIKIEDSKIFSESGAPLSKAISESIKAELAGLEWAIGIPGKIGGAINGNAGAFRRYTSGIVESVEALDATDLKIKTFSNEECQFAYRDSIFKKNPNLIILSAIFKLQKSTSEEVNRTLREIIKKRNSVDEAGLKCAGCVFKNIRWSRSDLDKDSLLTKFPELRQFSDFSAIPTAFLIDQLGLKGVRVGNVKVFQKHANYFINIGAATAEEVIMLIGIAKEKVHQKYGILLEEEIQYVGFDF